MTRLFDAKPFIIAEVGSNWRDLNDCLRSIAVAKECGADAVKFQLFTWAAMYAEPLTNAGPGTCPYLDRAWLGRLREHCDAVGIEFMCSAFSPELVAAVDPFVEVHKVASAEAAWPQLLESVAKTGKPMLVSFGAKSEDEMVQIRRHLVEADAHFLDCVASYPADFSRYDDFCDGFSDHTLGYTATVDAAERGAFVIEKHFTAFPDLDTPDRPHSLTPTQFKRMVDIIRGRGVESEEQAMFLRANRRLIATRDVEQGEALLYGKNYGAYRSLVDDTRGLSPFAWLEVEGRSAAKAIKRGKSIGEGDFT